MQRVRAKRKTTRSTKRNGAKRHRKENLYRYGMIHSPRPPKGKPKPSQDSTDDNKNGKE